MTGTLYVLATPIGNLGDFSPRARETLENVALVLAEDTRHSGKLLSFFGLHKPLKSLHEHNEAARVTEVVTRLENGEDIALISDAGTPSVSDPGFRLLRELRHHGLRVSPIPGPSAVLAALSVCGLPTDRFTFLGFPPKSGGKRKSWLEEAATHKETLVLFLTPQRLGEKLQEIHDIFGDRNATLCRELTKLHEEILSMKLSELTKRYDLENVRGGNHSRHRRKHGKRGSGPGNAGRNRRTTQSRWFFGKTSGRRAVPTLRTSSKRSLQTRARKEKFRIIRFFSSRYLEGKYRSFGVWRLAYTISLSNMENVSCQGRANF